MKQNLINALDIDSFEDQDTGLLTLINTLTQEPTNATITLASKEHPSRKKIDLAKARKLRAAYVKNGKIPNTDPLEEIDEETDYLVSVTLGWNLVQGGKELAFTPESARTLYTDPKKQWIRAQVLDALNKNDLFIKSSVKA